MMFDSYSSIRDNKLQLITLAVPTELHNGWNAYVVIATEILVFPPVF